LWKRTFRRIFAHSDSLFGKYRSRSGGLIYLDDTATCCYSNKEKSPANTADQFTNIRTKDAFITARDKIGLQVLDPIEE
jgi:hypothetical protein